MYSIDMDTDGAGKLPQNSQTSTGESGNKFTIPGILHFIQHEWARFEMERAHWEVERAELQVNYILLDNYSFTVNLGKYTKMYKEYHVRCILLEGLSRLLFARIIFLESKLCQLTRLIYNNYIILIPNGVHISK